jgi:hypothetical protein
MAAGVTLVVNGQRGDGGKACEDIKEGAGGGSGYDIGWDFDGGRSGGGGDNVNDENSEALGRAGGKGETMLSLTSLLLSLSRSNSHCPLGRFWVLFKGLRVQLPPGHNENHLILVDLSLMTSLE